MDDGIRRHNNCGHGPRPHDGINPHFFLTLAFSFGSSVGGTPASLFFWVLSLPLIACSSSSSPSPSSPCHVTRRVISVCAMDHFWVHLRVAKRVRTHEMEGGGKKMKKRSYTPSATPPPLFPVQSRFQSVCKSVFHGRKCQLMCVCCCCWPALPAAGSTCQIDPLSPLSLFLSVALSFLFFPREQRVSFERVERDGGSGRCCGRQACSTDTQQAQAHAPQVFWSGLGGPCLSSLRGSSFFFLVIQFFRAPGIWPTGGLVRSRGSHMTFFVGL